MRIAISLEALTGSFETDMKKAGATAASFAKKAEDDLKKAGVVIGAAVAAAAVAMTALVKQAINNADELSNMSAKVGVSVEALSALKYQAGLADVELGALQASLVKLTKTAADAVAGGKDQVATFKALGISVTDATGKMKPMDELLAEVADKFESYEDGAEKTALALRLFGKSGADMIPLLNEGSRGMRAAAEEAKAYGLIVTDAGGKASDEFNDNLEKLSKSAAGLGNQIAMRLVPALASFSGELADGAKQGDAYAQIADTIANAIKLVAQVLVVTHGVIEAFVNLLAAAVDTVIGFAEVVGGLAGNIWNATKSIALAMQGDFAGAGEAAKLAADYAAVGWENGSTRIQTAWSAADSGIQGALDRSAKLFDEIDRRIGGATQRATEFEIAMAGVLDKATLVMPGLSRMAALVIPDIWGGVAKPTTEWEGGAATPAKDRAPTFGNTDGAAKAATDAKKAADEILKLNEAVYGGIENLRLMGQSFELITDPLVEVQRKYEDAGRAVSDALTKEIEEIEKLRATTGDAVAAANQHAAAQEYAATAMRNAAASRDASIVAINQERDVTGRYVKELRDEAKLIGMTSQQRRVEAIVLRAVAEAKRLNTTVNEDLIRQEAKLSIAMQDSADTLEGLIQQFGQKSPFEQMSEDIEKAGEALEKAFGDDNKERIKQLTKTVGELRQQQLLFATDAIGQGISSLKSMATEGSKAYKALEVAQQATNLVAAIGAVVNQGSGDPYTAFARMAAMAAAVASLGFSIGNMAGSFSDTAAQRQASQGTGSVLGDSEAKSESILNATEITASATTQLVGINRGMLNALQSLQAGIGSATGMLARGAGDADFSGMNLAVDGDFSNTAFGKSFEVLFGGGILDADPFGILGGKSKITDQGIVIFGGALNELLENISIGAYQEVQSRSWAFGSTRTREGITDVSDQFGDQFSLIISSIADTVREGATALGLLPDEIQSALEAFRVEEIRISLKDLSAEEQQAELQAVFSKIFDDLAGHVVPFIEQFQKVGEGLGETLVRVATGVQVTREAVRYLGFALDETDPEKFAQISEGLIDMVGGIDALIEGMTSFVNNFAPESHRLKVATDAINSAFEQAGLAVPETAEAMWDLMQSFDATTEEGRESIATLLRLAGVSKEYYDLLDKAETSRRDYAAKSVDLKIELGIGSEFIAARAEVEAWTSSMIEDLDSLARAAGRAGASEQDLVNVHRVAAQRVAQLIEGLKDKARDLAVELGYITQADTLESLNAQIEALQSSSQYAAEGIGEAVDSIRQQMDLLLGDLSPFNDQKKLELALEGLRAGTVDPQQVLEIGRRLYASTSAYTDLFNNVMGMANFGAQTGGTNSASAGETGDGRSLVELIRLRDEMLEAQRPELADQLARRLAELSVATGDEFAELAETMGWTLDRLAADLGLSDEQLQGYLAQLVEQFESQDFIEVADLITAAIESSTDRIVDAIKLPASDAVEGADDRIAAITENMDRERANESERIADELVSLGDRLISAIMSSTNGQTGELAGVLEETRRDMREAVLDRRATNERVSAR